MHFPGILLGLAILGLAGAAGAVTPPPAPSACAAKAAVIAHYSQIQMNSLTSMLTPGGRLTLSADRIAKTEAQLAVQRKNAALAQEVKSLYPGASYSQDEYSAAENSSEAATLADLERCAVARRSRK